MLFTLILFACTSSEAPTTSPLTELEGSAAPTIRAAIGVSVPMTGPSAAKGRAAVDGVRLAVPPGVDVVVIDEQLGDPVPTALSDDRIFGVVAHITQVGAERWGAGWTGTDLAVVMAAPASIAGLPRVLAGADRHVRCATAFMGRGSAVVVHDGSGNSTEISNAAERELGARSRGLVAIDPRLMAREADRVRTIGASWLVYTGSPGDGGNMLRALRQLGGRVSFLGIGLYDPRFAAAAGRTGDGAIVTSQDRPALDEEVVDRWRIEHRTEPPAVALNAYDAATLLVEALKNSMAAAPAASPAVLRVAVKQRLAEVHVYGASGPLQLDAEGVAEPAWCTGYKLHDGKLYFHGLAKVIDGRVEQVDIDAQRLAQDVAQRAESQAAQHGLSTRPLP